MELAREEAMVRLVPGGGALFRTGGWETMKKWEVADRPSGSAFSSAPRLFGPSGFARSPGAWVRARREMGHSIFFPFFDKFFYDEYGHMKELVDVLSGRGALCVRPWSAAAVTDV